MNAARETPCRLIVDAPTGGVWNMAVDEALLDLAAERQIATLRFYRWAEPTLSLGYFQGYRERNLHAASRELQLLRRPSGGGAIVHDNELTYCLALPADNRWAKETARLYLAVHEAVAATLARNGITAETVGEANVSVAAASQNAEPFLCFQRRGPGDLVVDGFKVCGSAQRRRRGAILQHGSLLLGRSGSAPELPGISELTGHTLEIPHLAEVWGAEIAIRLGLSLAPGKLVGVELDRVRTLALEKYDTLGWTQRR